MIYFLIAFLMFVLLYIYDIRDYKKHKIIWYNVLLISLILLAGLRYRVGGDTLGYIEMYDKIPSLFMFNANNISDYKFQPIWMLYCVLLKTISPSFILLQFTNAIFINSVFFSFIKKHSQYPFTVVFFYFLLYYLLFNFEIMREALAVAVFILGFHFWEQKKWLPYFLIAIISFNIHVSAVILFILPFLGSIKIKLKYIIVILLIIGVSAKPIIRLLFENLSFIWILNSGLNDNITAYSKMLSLESYNINYFLLNWSQTLIIPLFLLTLNRKFKVEIKYPILIYTMLIFAAFGSVSFIFYRFQNYFIIFYLIFISDFFIRTLRNIINLKFVYISLFIFIMIFPTIYIYNSSWYSHNVRVYQKYIPYYSILNPKKDNSREEIRYYK